MESKNTSIEKAYDAVVVGAGATGTLAAKLLVEGGLRILVLDAGSERSALRSRFRRFSHKAIRRVLGVKSADAIFRRRQPIQSRCYAWSGDPDSFVDDFQCPYGVPSSRPFIWLRSRQLGGRMKVRGHGGQYYRLSASDFYPVDGLSEPWPLQPGELDPWYALVERWLGLCGTLDNLPWLPDGEVAHVLEPTSSESRLQRSIIERWPGARPILGRSAPFPYLEDANNTDRLQIQTGAIVRRIEVAKSGRVQGVEWFDQRAGRIKRVESPLVFLCASALESTRILLLSRSPDSPIGLGGSSGVLGHYLMDHIRVQAIGKGPALIQDFRTKGASCIYLPRFDARELQKPEPRRGFGVQLSQGSSAGSHESYFSSVSFGEMLPRFENRVTLDPTLKDAWSIPSLQIDCAHDGAELQRAQAQIEALRDLAKVAGAEITEIDSDPWPPGSANHECGTARMGHRPSNSVLDPNNECWEARGLYLTDGACMPSQGTQNPTLTLLALTARACHRALNMVGC